MLRLIPYNNRDMAAGRWVCTHNGSIFVEAIAPAPFLAGRAGGSVNASATSYTVIYTVQNL